MIRKGMDYSDLGPGYAQYSDTYVVRKDFKGRTIVESLGEANATNYAKPETMKVAISQGVSRGVGAEVSALQSAYKSSVDPKGKK